MPLGELETEERGGCEGLSRQVKRRHLPTMATRLPTVPANIRLAQSSKSVKGRRWGWCSCSRATATYHEAQRHPTHNLTMPLFVWTTARRTQYVQSLTYSSVSIRSVFWFELWRVCSDLRFLCWWQLWWRFRWNLPRGLWLGSIVLICFQELVIRVVEMAGG